VLLPRCRRESRETARRRFPRSNSRDDPTRVENRSRSSEKTRFPDPVRREYRVSRDRPHVRVYVVGRRDETAATIRVVVE